jgi:hypothetical protein
VTRRAHLNGFCFLFSRRARVSQWVGLPNNSYKPITNTAWVRARLCKLQKGCTRLAAASDKVYQLLAHGRWFSPGTPASSTTKTGRHDIAEILLKVVQSKSNQIKYIFATRIRFPRYHLATIHVFWCIKILCIFYIPVYNGMPPAGIAGITIGAIVVVGIIFAIMTVIL